MVTKFVEIVETEVLIDSRVYCQDVINVKHGDWLQNVIYKHQATIEEYFGHLRFENGDGVKRPQGGGKQEKYVMLSEPQCNFCLALSNNSKEVVIKKAELIADFEAAKRSLKEHYERQFAATTPVESGFCKSCKDVLACTGISRRDTVIKATRQYLIEGKDYVVEYSGGWHLYFYTQEAYNYLCINHRSKVGLDPDLLPDRLEVQPRKLAKDTPERKNQVFPKYRQPDLF